MSGFRDPQAGFLRSRLIPLDQPPPEAQPAGDEDFHDNFAQGAAAPAAVLVGLAPRPAGMTVLLTRRADSLKRHTGQFALPGGRCDEGEGPAWTAIREAHEEIGLDPLHVQPLGFSDPFHTRTGFWVTPLVALVAPQAELTANPDEVAEIFEAPLAFLMDPANHQQRSAFMAGEMRRFFAIDYEGRVIWGITAAVLQRLYVRLYGEG